MEIKKVSRGIVIYKSSYSFADTIKKLRATFEEKQIKIFAVIDQQAEAEAVGLTLMPSTLFIFGNPKVGTQFMQYNSLAALDLPLKALIREDENGEVTLSLNTTEYIATRYSLPDNFIDKFVDIENLLGKSICK